MNICGCVTLHERLWLRYMNVCGCVVPPPCLTTPSGQIIKSSPLCEHGSSTTRASVATMAEDCCVCFTVMMGAVPWAKMWSCVHCVCIDCASTLWQNDGQPCPLCRTPMTPEAGIRLGEARRARAAAPLIENGNFNAVFNMEEGWTPLMNAAERGDLSTVLRLLAAPGIDVNLTSQAGDTALCLAACNGHVGQAASLCPH